MIALGVALEFRHPELTSMFAGLAGLGARRASLFERYVNGRKEIRQANNDRLAKQQV
jgi:hypothetical protein